MSVKQDRSMARTAEDLKRQYQFGKRFSEMLGLIDDTRDKVDSVESSLHNEILEQSTTLMRDTEQIVMQATESVRNDVEEISSTLEMKLDAEAVEIQIDQRISEGVDKVVTKTGYRFDSDGLTIAKLGEEMENTLDNTGMYVRRSGEDILTANNEGVQATNLHANTYLIIGSDEGRSRFEDYGINRTGLFWVGG